MRWLPILLLIGCVEQDPIPDVVVRPEAGPVDAAVIQDADVFDAGRPMDASPTMDASLDAGLPDADPPDAGDPCRFGEASRSRLDPRAGLAPTRFAALEQCLSARPQEAADLVDGFMDDLQAAGGGAPFDGNDALLFHRGDASGITVSGSFDGWPDPGVRAFSRVANSDLWVARIPMQRSERHQYKLTFGPGQWRTHEHNPWVVWDGFDQQGVGDFNNEIVGPDHQLQSSVLHRRLIVDRNVFLQLPISFYETPSEPMGILYVSDGNEMLTRAGMQSVVDNTVAMGRVGPLALAYVALPNQNIRIDEYTFGTATANGDAYVQMLVEEIAPLIEADLSLLPMPDHRGIAGSSLGGLIAVYAAWIRPDFFRKVGGQSSTLWWADEEIVNRFAAGPAQPLKIYLDSGEPNDNMAINQQMADVLAAQGYDHLHIIEPGGLHEWSFWAGRFDELIEFLY